MRLVEIAAESINTWLFSLEEKGAAPRTIANRRRDLLLVLNAAVDDGLLTLGPVRRIKVPKRLPTAWTHEELVRLLLVTRRYDDAYFIKTGLPKGPFWRSLIRFKYDTALRLDDVLSAKVSNLNLPGGRYRCLVSKTLIEEDRALSPLTVRDIKLILPPHTGKRNLVWDWRSGRAYFHRQFRELVEAAGIRAGTTRWIRRSSSSYLERDYPGMSGRHLGHRTPGLADQNYNDPAITGRDVVPPPLPDV